MDSRVAPSPLRISVFLCAACMLLFGYVISEGGYCILSRWHHISPPYAAIGVIWVVAGPIMLASGVGIFLSLGRHKLPLWAGSISVICAGTSLIAGVLSYVVPCAGPS